MNTRTHTRTRVHGQAFGVWVLHDEEWACARPFVPLEPWSLAPLAWARISLVPFPNREAVSSLLPFSFLVKVSLQAVPSLSVSSWGCPLPPHAVSTGSG